MIQERWVSILNTPFSLFPPPFRPVDKPFCHGAGWKSFFASFPHEAFGFFTVPQERLPPFLSLVGFNSRDFLGVEVLIFLALDPRFSFFSFFFHPSETLNAGCPSFHWEVLLQITQNTLLPKKP